MTLARTCNRRAWPVTGPQSGLARSPVRLSSAQLTRTPRLSCRPTPPGRPHSLAVRPGGRRTLMSRCRLDRSRGAVAADPRHATFRDNRQPRLSGISGLYMINDTYVSVSKHKTFRDRRRRSATRHRRRRLWQSDAARSDPSRARSAQAQLNGTRARPPAQAGSRCPGRPGRRGPQPSLRPGRLGPQAEAPIATVT